jgi:hypothetical protein
MSRHHAGDNTHAAAAAVIDVNAEIWVSPPDAISLIRSGLGETDAHLAREALTDACATGEVRSRHRNVLGETELTPAAAWHRPALQLSRPLRSSHWTLRVGDCRLYSGGYCDLTIFWDVEISETDLCRWVAEKRHRDETLARSEGKRRATSPAGNLKPATAPRIRSAIERVYDADDLAGRAPPNLKQLPKRVQPVLERDGYFASQNQIMKIGDEFKSRRAPAGRPKRHK